MQRPTASALALGAVSGVVRSVEGCELQWPLALQRAPFRFCPVARQRRPSPSARAGEGRQTKTQRTDSEY